MLAPCRLAHQEVFGNERVTASLLDRLVRRSYILLLEGESFRFRQSLEQQVALPATT
jgi:hypothetical protein